MEYKLIIDGMDKHENKESVEFSMIENEDMIKIALGYTYSYISIEDFKKIEKLISLKE